MSGVQLASTNASNQQPDGGSSLAADEAYASIAVSQVGQPGVSPSVFSPDGTLLVFTTAADDIAGSAGGVVVKNLVTGAVTNITAPGETNVGTAAFTADGSKVIFQATLGSGSSSSQQFFETTLATGQTVQVTSGGAATNSQLASANGSSLDVASGNYQTNTVFNVATGRSVTVGNSDTFAIAATPDASQVVYQTNAYNQDTGTQQLYAENTTTGASTLVSATASGVQGNADSFSAVVTPAGDKVVFASSSTDLSPSAPAGGVFVKDLASGSLGVVVADPVQAAGSTYSGDDSVIATSTDGSKVLIDVSQYSNTTASNGTNTLGSTEQLQIATLGGGVVAVSPSVAETNAFYQSGQSDSISTNGSDFSSITLSPDGTKIAYVLTNNKNYNSSYSPSTGSTTSGSQSAQVYVFDATTGTTTAIPGAAVTSTNGNFTPATELTFSPDGSKLAVVLTTSQPAPYYQQSSSVLVTDLASGAQVSEPLASFTAGNFAFSPDGTRLAFVAATNQVDPASSSTQQEVFVTPVCFAAGTAIRTLRAGIEVDVAVERLAVGDTVVTASGEHRPIRWLGHRRVDCRRRPEARPIRVAAHGFAPDRPARDLLLSPGHAVCVDLCGEVLIPVGHLADGGAIASVAVEAITYWHVELDSHDVLLAENLACESYLEMGNRRFFCEVDAVSLAASPDPEGSDRSHADFCRPVHCDGPIVEAVRARLTARAASLGRSDRPSAAPACATA